MKSLARRALPLGLASAAVVSAAASGAWYRRTHVAIARFVSTIAFPTRLDFLDDGRLLAVADVADGLRSERVVVAVVFKDSSPPSMPRLHLHVELRSIASGLVLARRELPANAGSVPRFSPAGDRVIVAAVAGPHDSVVWSPGTERLVAIEGISAFGSRPAASLSPS